MSKTKQPSEELLSQDHLLEQDDQEGSGEFRKLLEEFTSNRKFEEGEIVTGTVLRISGESVIVDVGFKSEGIVPVVEFLDRTAIEIGKKVDLLLEQVEDQDGQIVLSKIKADFIKVWDKVQKSLDSEVVVDGKVLRKVKGGLIIDLMGVDAFLPGSQIGLRPLETIDSLLGQTIPLKIIKINKKKRNIVVSRRVVLDADRDKQRAVILAEIDKGQVREGIAKNITDFGVFVDLGGLDGLLHITDMSWGRISHPSELVQIGQKIKVKILEYDRERSRVSLGLKQLTTHPWESIVNHVKRAIELDPNYASAYGLYGMNILSAKRFDEAAEYLAKAERLDPTSRSIGIYIAWKYYFDRDFDRAIEQCRKVLELDSSVTTPYTILRSAYEQKGMHKEAVEAELARLRNLEPGASEQLNEAFRKGGIEAFWEEQIEIIRSGKGSKTEVADYILASRLALLGRKEESLAEIEKGFAARGSMWHEITVEPAFDTLRGLPAFQRLEQVVGHAE